VRIKKIIYYQFELKGEIKKNKTFIKELRGKIIKIKMKLKTLIHDQINLNMLNFST